MWFKKHPIATAFIALGIIAGAIFLYTYIMNRYFKKIDIKSPKSNHNILVIGDSLTAHNNSYAEYLKNDIPAIQLTKVAEGGRRTRWMLDNAWNDLNSGKYAAVFILGGTNDVYALTGSADAKRNLQSMYDAAHRAGSKVVAITIPPSDYYSLYNSKYGAETEELNNWIRNNKTVDFIIDLNSLVKNPDGTPNTSYFVSDNLHLNSAAHKLIAQTIEQTVFQ